jgi:BirA family biotin operon repressor/biotin-[acetyl-CoA-carboxylase] ligase
MYIIKLNAIDSTNAYLRAMSVQYLPKDWTVVTAEAQTH